MNGQSFYQSLNAFAFLTLGYLGWLMHNDVISFDVYFWLRDSLYAVPMNYFNNGSGTDHWLYQAFVTWTEGM